MSNLIKHNPILRNKLASFIAKGDAQGLCLLLQSLRVSEFRTAGYLLAEQLLPQLASGDYWNFFLKVVPTFPKAYLGTFLKAGVRLYQQHKLQLNEEALSQFALQTNAIDHHKTMEAFLPLLAFPEEVETLLRALHSYEARKAYTFLLKANTLCTFYHLFCLLKLADEPALTKQVIALLLRQNKPISYNMASLLKQYFGLHDVPCTFALQIEHYKLSRADEGYASFKKVVLP